MWDKLYQVYNHYYDKYNSFTLNNITEALCSLLTIEEKENVNLLSNDIIINYFKKILEAPVIRIIKIAEIISNKNTEINDNKEKQQKIRLEIVKNFDVVTFVLKQSSFIDDKIIINSIFD